MKLRGGKINILLLKWTIYRYGVVYDTRYSTKLKASLSKSSNFNSTLTYKSLIQSNSNNDMINISDSITHDEALLYQYIKVQLSKRQTH